jgi:hypothetical protein
MTDDARTTEELSAEELEAHEAEQLPDREVMSIIDPSLPILGRAPDDDALLGGPVRTEPLT